jgi:uncharacterized alpha-E superfamily protein
MLSRVADSLYWIGRYLERAEHTVRLLDVNMSLMLERSTMKSDVRWQRVLHALGTPAGIDSDDADSVIRALCYDTLNRASIAACVFSARENARQVRDEISSEQWQKLNHLYHSLSEVKSHHQYATVSDSMQSVLDGIHLFQGVTDTTMPHGEGWQFIRAGRHMERSTQLATLLELYYREVFTQSDAIIDASQYLEWVGLLRCCTAFEAYCTVYTADLTPARILEFLLLNPVFPHSLRYSVDSLVGALAGIQQEGRRAPAEELTRRTPAGFAELHPDQRDH